MTFSKLTPIAALLALGLVAGCNKASDTTTTTTSPTSTTAPSDAASAAGGTGTSGTSSIGTPSAGGLTTGESTTSGPAGGTAGSTGTPSATGGSTGGVPATGGSPGTTGSGSGAADTPATPGTGSGTSPGTGGGAGGNTGGSGTAPATGTTGPRSDAGGGASFAVVVPSHGWTVTAGTDARPTTSATSAPAAPTPGAASVVPNGADRTFVANAAVDGLYEVEAGKLAAARATNPDLKHFGEMLVQDHTKTNEELKAIVTAKNLDLPTRLPKRKQVTLDNLGKLSGDKFDRAFVQQIGLKDHRASIALFEKQVASGRDTDLKAFAEKALPSLRNHLQEAEKMAGDHKGKR